MGSLSGMAAGEGSRPVPPAGGLVVGAATDLEVRTNVPEQIAPATEAAVPLQVRATTEETRRRVTVLFCDLVGSTELAGQLDPEELRELLARYQNAAAEALESYGGRLHYTLGDGLMASWGWPRAREDDAARAVLAGLAVVHAVATAAGGGDAPAAGERPAIEVRVGVHSGLAVIADSRIGSRHEVANLIGETPNLAARLQSIAEPGSVVMSEDTEDLVRGRFEVRNLGSVPLKGVHRPVGVFGVVRPLEPDAPADPAQVLGRPVEVARLEAAWAEVSRQDAGTSGRVVVVSGDAGMGKSHLSEHLRHHAIADGGGHVLVRCTGLQQTHAFYAIRRTVERLSGIQPGDAVDLRRARLAAFCADHPRLAGEQALDVLSALVGAPGELPSALNPERRRGRTFELLLDLLDGLAEQRPQLVVVEDVQWADPSTAEFLRLLLDRGPAARTLVVLTTRDPSALRAPEAMRLELAPLGADAIRDILAAAAPSLPEPVRRLAVERADGVPLFAEELGRLLRRDQTGTTALQDVPPRLQDLLVARLDERPHERPLLQLIAIIGTSAVRSFIEQVSGRSSDEVRQGLDVLVHAGILLDEGPAEDPVYRFQHVLLRDATYSTLLRSRRRELHREIVTALLRSSSEDWLQPDLVAHHLEQAGELAASAAWWYRAARTASAVAAHHEVVTHLRHILDLLRRTGPVVDAPELEILVLLGVSLVALEGYTSPAVAEVHARARELLDETPERVGRPGFFYPLWAYHHVRADREASAALSEQLWQRVRDDADEQPAVAAAMVGYDAFELADLDRACAMLRRAQRYDVEPDRELPHELWSSSTVLLGVARWLRGEREAGREDLAAAVRRADALGPPTGDFTRAFVHSYAAWACLLDDEPEASLAHAERAMQEARAGGYSSWFAASCMHAAGARARCGEAVDVAALEGVLAAWRAGGAELFRPVFLGWLGEAQAAVGDLEAARRAFDEGIEHIRHFGGVVYQPELLRLRARIDAGRGDLALAHDGLRRAQGVAERYGLWSLALRAAADLVELGGDDADSRAALARAVEHVQGRPAEEDVLRARRLLGSR